MAIDPRLELLKAIHGNHGRITIKRYESHVAAEEVDHLARIARLLDG